MASSKILQSSYCLQTKMREGNAFTGVCLFTGGYSPPPPGGYVQRDGYSPPPLPTDTWDTTGYGQQAGGTHSTDIWDTTGYHTVNKGASPILLERFVLIFKKKH